MATGNIFRGYNASLVHAAWVTATEFFKNRKISAVKWSIYLNIIKTNLLLILVHLTMLSAVQNIKHRVARCTHYFHLVVLSLPPIHQKIAAFASSDDMSITEVLCIVLYLEIYNLSDNTQLYSLTDFHGYNERSNIIYKYWHGDTDKETELVQGRDGRTNSEAETGSLRSRTNLRRILDETDIT